MDEEYRLIWSLESSKQVASIKNYLSENWGHEAVKDFLSKLKLFEKLVTQYPKLYPASTRKPNLRKAVITKQQSIIYTIDNKIIRVITVIDNRRNNTY